jgi:ribonuclease HII
MNLADFDAAQRREAQGLLIVGIDEAGRGPLAGPVVAAACHIPPQLYDDEIISQINDSKKLTPAKRFKIYNALIKMPIEYCLGFATSKEIDKINILQATFLAMRRALAKFDGKNILALVDGNRQIPNIEHKQKTIIRGDGLSLSIAAASILAKVTRDGYMEIIDKNFPIYGFCGHKGYCTEQHIKAVRTYGPCKEHRKSFEPISSICCGLFGEGI